VAKGSLYNTFGSKEALVRAYLDARHENTTGRLQRAMDAVEDPRDKILAVFDAQGQLFRQPDFHGCAFVAASAEADPGSRIEEAVENYRAWIRTMFADLAKAAGIRQPHAWPNSCNCSTTAPGSLRTWTATRPLPRLPAPPRRP